MATIAPPRLSAIVRGRLRPAAPDQPAREFPVWPAALLAVPIVARVPVFVAALLFESWSPNPNHIIPPWAQLLQAACFMALAFVLLRYGRADRRAWALGLFVLDAGATLLTPFVRAIENPSFITALTVHLRTDAFQAALLWYFAALFPRSSVRPGLARVFRLGTAVAFWLGVVLVAADTFADTLVRTGPPALASLAQELRRSSPSSSDWYFTLQFLWLTPLFVLMPWKLRDFGPGDRRRFALLMVGIVGGFLPLAANVVLESIWPWFAAASEPYARLKGAVIVIALTAVPLAGAYAALVQHALDVRLIVRRAAQYILARSVIRGVAAVPAATLGLMIVVNWDQPLAELLAGTRGVVLLSLAAAGVAAAAGRRRLLSMLDRHFFRDRVDASTTLLRLADAVRQVRTLEAYRQLLGEAIDAALHPESSVLFVAGADDYLHAVDADLLPLARRGALAQLVSASDTPLDLAGADRQVTDRLLPAERAWVDAANAVVVAPLRGADNLVGVLALGPKKSELPYAREDLALLAAVSAAMAASLARVVRAETDAGEGDAALADPPARECVDCGAVVAASVLSCECGGLLQRAAVPVTLTDRVRFVRRIGIGAMGVVYRAIDLRLQQPRAVKTLPVADAVLMARMRREAKAMATVQHANLATLYGLEYWRGAPMLVMEYLQGGTLADRLRTGPLPVDQALRIGVSISEALETLHATGLLHRDIKPSNIGFTAGGAPKLLDFGLATLLPRVASHAAASLVEGSTWAGSSVIGEDGVRGTPAYLSAEVLGGAPPTVADDLWALAVTLLESAVGDNPFRAPTVAATIARVLTDPMRAAETAAVLPPAARALFGGLLGPAAARPQTAGEFTARLERTLQSGG
ncbi:MAG: protein kinase [Acidobacteriota bacterium]